MLNKEQQAVVEHKNGPLLVVAGAGSGKTTTIVERIANLINSEVEPEEILAITFTNKAASELKERVKRKIKSNRFPEVKTFHSLAVSVLREFYKDAGLKKSFIIYDRDDSVSLLKKIIKRLGINPKTITPSYVIYTMAKHKNEGLSLQDFYPTSPVQEQLKRIWQEYEIELSKSNALDFDSLLLKLNKLLDKKAVADTLSKRWKYIHVDEYQDTNTVQFLILKKLAKHNNICAVGDIDQAIYSWRFAKPENLLAFEKEFPNVKTIFLKTNYRSSKTIVESADKVIEKNKKRFPKESQSAQNSGEPIALYNAVTPRQEAEFVAEQIKLLNQKGVKYKDIAILYRTNFQSRQFEEIFIKEKIPYQVVGVKFFNRQEIKDILSFLKASINRNSLEDLSRSALAYPKVGKKTLSCIINNDLEPLSPSLKKVAESYFNFLDKIKESLEKNSLSETLEFIYKNSGLKDKYSKSPDDQERIQNIYELITLAKGYEQEENPTEEFLANVALSSDQDEIEDDNKVKLMTIHAAKGLEFDSVFIVGLEQGLFPIENFSEDEEKDEEEERRLFYVAITRAKNRVTLTYCNIRTIYGQERVCEPSEFIQDIPEENLLVLNKTQKQDRPSLLDDIYW